MSPITFWNCEDTAVHIMLKKMKKGEKKKTLCPKGFHFQAGRDRHAPTFQKEKKKIVYVRQG